MGQAEGINLIGNLGLDEVIGQVVVQIQRSVLILRDPGADHIGVDRDNPVIPKVKGDIGLEISVELFRRGGQIRVI